MKRLGLYVMFCLLFACGSSPKVDNYILYAEPTNAIKALNDSSPKVFLKPLIFPDYLNRPQIVIRENQVKLEIQEFKRWAEPLKFSFLRVFKAAMQNQGVNVISNKQFRSENFDYQLSLEVISFEVSREQKVDLKVSWILLNSTNNKVIASAVEILAVEVVGEDFSSKIRAQAQVVERLGGLLAKQIHNNGEQFKEGVE